MQPAELEEAKLLLQEELMDVNKAYKHEGDVSQEDIEVWRSAATEFIYLPSQQRYGRIASATNSDKIESLQVSPSVLTPRNRPVQCVVQQPMPQWSV